MKLLVITSVLPAEEARDGKPHPLQRAFPFPEVPETASLQEVFQAITEWLEEIERIERTREVRGTVNGVSTSFTTKALPFVEEFKPHMLLDLLQRAFPLKHNAALKAALQAEFGKEEKRKRSSRSRTKALDVSNVG